MILVTEIPPQAAHQRMTQSGMPAQIADGVLATLAGSGTGPGGRVQPPVRQLTGRPRRPFTTGPPATPPHSARSAR